MSFTNGIASLPQNHAPIQTLKVLLTARFADSGLPLQYFYPLVYIPMAVSFIHAQGRTALVRRSYEKAIRRQKKWG
jgi:hypothetical protein